jgi:hypothetical protein
MKMGPFQLPKKKSRQNGSSCSGRISQRAREHRESISNQNGSSGEGESGEESNLKKGAGKKEHHRRSSTATTPNKKKTSPTVNIANSNLVSTSRRPSMPQLTTTKPTSRKLSVSVANKGGWYSYADQGSSATPTITTKSNACSMPNSPGLSAAITRSRKQAPNSSPHNHHHMVVNNRKNSLGNTATTNLITPQQHVDRESNALAADKGK